MTDLATLELDLINAIGGAETVAALEEVRVAALGKSGSVSGLLKGMGAMSPDQRREQGPMINGLRDRVSAAITARKAELEAAELDARLEAEHVGDELGELEDAWGGGADCFEQRGVTMLARDTLVLMADRAGAGAGGRDDVVEAGEGVDEPTNHGHGIAGEAGVDVHLPAAALRLGEHHLDAETFEQADRGLPGLGEHGVREAGDEESDAHRAPSVDAHPVGILESCQ